MTSFDSTAWIPLPCRVTLLWKAKSRMSVQGLSQIRRRKMSPQPRTVRVALFRDIFVWYGNWSSCLTETGRKWPKIISSHQRARIPLQMAARIWPITLNSQGVYFKLIVPIPFGIRVKAQQKYCRGASLELFSLFSLSDFLVYISVVF